MDSYEVSTLEVAPAANGGLALRTTEISLRDSKAHQVNGQGDPIVLFNGQGYAGEVVGSVRLYVRKSGGTNIRISSLRVTCVQ